MERTRMEGPSVILKQLQDLFSEVLDSEISAAEPKKSFPAPETGVRVVGSADEEMKRWWVLAERRRDMMRRPMDIFLLPKEEQEEISRRVHLACANHDLLHSIFRALVARTFGDIGPSDELAMYKQWVIGTSTPRSRLAPSGDNGHPCLVNHQF